MAFANLHTDVTPPAQVPVIASLPVENLSPVEELAKVSPATAPAKHAAVLKTTDSEAVDGADAIDVSSLPRELGQFFDATTAAFNDSEQQKSNDRADPLTSGLGLNELDELAGSVGDESADVEVGILETEKNDPILNDVSAQVDRLFSVEDYLFSFWSYRGLPACVCLTC